MKVYLVIEGSGFPAPNDPADTIWGVFLTQEGATECMKSHCRYINSQGWPTRIGKDGKARDDQGHLYLQILQWELGFCKPRDWI